MAPWVSDNLRLNKLSNSNINSNIKRWANLQDLDNSARLNNPPENALKLHSCKVYGKDSCFFVSICKHLLSVS